VYYGVVLHTGGRQARKQAYVSLGGGVRIFRGTGTEASYQPLSQYAYLTKTNTMKPMGDAGGGIKFAITTRLVLRTEFRDYITGFPTELITPALGATFHRGILHDFVPMAGLSYRF
jgi:hypothetical protein